MSTWFLGGADLPNIELYPNFKEKSQAPQANIFQSVFLFYFWARLVFATNGVQVSSILSGCHLSQLSCGSCHSQSTCRKQWRSCKTSWLTRRIGRTLPLSGLCYCMAAQSIDRLVRLWRLVQVCVRAKARRRSRRPGRSVLARTLAPRGA